MCHNALNCEDIKQLFCASHIIPNINFRFNPEFAKNCVMFRKNQVIFLTIFIRYANVCTDTIYQIETSKEIRSRKRADIINLDKLPLNLVDISVSQWSTVLRRFWCGALNTATSPCYHMLHVAVTTMFRFSNRLLRDLRTLRPKPVDIQKTTWFCFLSRAVWTIPTRFRLWQWSSWILWVEF